MRFKKEGINYTKTSFYVKFRSHEYKYSKNFENKAKYF